MKPQIGQKFNKLTIIQVLGTDKNHDRKVFCKCDCGGFKVTLFKNLKLNSVMSCGCLQRSNQRRYCLKINKI